jgi:transposase
MQHIAIDLGGKESQICIREADGRIVEECRRPTAGLARYLGRREKARVVVETCSEAFAIADAALSFGHEVRVVPCSLVRSIGVGARGVKTDRRDAQVLSEVSCRIDLPSVHIPSSLSRERKTLCGMREALVEARTKLINTVRGWCRTQNHRLPTGDTSTFVRRVRVSFEKEGIVLPSCVARQLEAVDGLSEQILQADEELASEARADETCTRLMSVPGVGPVTAIRFVAAIDDVQRFGGAHAVQSYLGLVPGERSSSERQRKTAITKAGSPKLRWALGQASWSARRTRKDHPIIQWCLQIEQRRGRAVAMVALARKLAGILFAVWRDGTVYQPDHARPKLAA